MAKRADGAESGGKGTTMRFRFLEVLGQFVMKRAPWTAPFLRAVPVHLRLPILILFLGLTAAPILWGLWEPVAHLVEEMYGPDVLIGLVSPQDIEHHGSRTLLSEFEFNKGKLAVPIRRDSDVKALFNAPSSVALLAIPCAGLTKSAGRRLFKLILVAANRGDKTAKDYGITIVFSSNDADHADPGVRISDVGTDALKVTYLYRQDPDLGAKGCAAPGDGGDGPAPVSKLTRDTYNELRLTRDVLMLQGTLEAHFFQVAAITVTAPADLRSFAALFNVECANCSWFYRTTSYGQLVSLQ